MTSQVRYVQQRELAAGGVAGDPRTIAFSVRQELRSHAAIRDRRISMGGQSFTDLKRIDHFWNVQTVLITSTTTQDQFDEFFDSVAGGEGFEFDPSGAGFISVEMEGGQMTPERDGVLIRFRYSFRFRERQ